MMYGTWNRRQHQVATSAGKLYSEWICSRSKHRTLSARPRAKGKERRKRCGDNRGGKKVIGTPAKVVRWKKGTSRKPLTSILVAKISASIPRLRTARHIPSTAVVGPP